MPVNALDVENVSVNHNGVLAVNKISFSVQEGDLLGIVGPNGAGKTTLFRAILGLQSFKDRRISELSGGEQQRAFIAKALVKEPLLMILDEPVTGVDMDVQNKFYAVLKKINKENKITIVWSSHDLNAISDLATRIACMNRDLFFHGEKEEFFANKDLLKTYSESAMQLHMHKHDM